MKRLICKLLGHNYGNHTYCQRCGHDPLTELKTLIEDSPDSSMRDEARERFTEYENALKRQDDEAL